MKMKSILALVLALMLTMSAGSIATAESSALKDGNMVELTIVMPGNSSAPASLAAVEQRMNEIMADTIDATINFQILEWGVFADQMNLMLSSGEDVSLIFTWSNSRNFANRGQVMPITDLVKTYAPDAYKVLEKYLSGCEVNGELYGLPTFHEYASASGLVCRTDILEEIGVDPSTVKTWDDVDAVLAKVKEAHPEMDVLIPTEINKGMLKYYTTGEFDFVQSNVGVYANPDGEIKVVNTYATPEYKEMAERAYDWNQKGYFIADATTITDTRQDILKAGNAFGYIGKIHPGTATQEIRNSGRDITTIIVSDSLCATADVNFAQYMVPTACSSPEKAVAFLNLLYSNEEMQNLMLYGVEGTDYVVKDAENNVIGYPDSTDSSTVGWTNEPWLSGNASIASVWESDPVTIWNDYVTFNDTAALSPIYGFSYDSSNVKNEITAVENVITKYAAVIESGYADVETSLAEFNKELEAAGINNIVADMQSQIDAWTASK